MAEKPSGCVEESTGVIMPEGEEAKTGQMQSQPVKEAAKMLARVGKEAPDFELTAYHEGGFKNERLSNYRGKWVLLCFYPGDFTFV
jgi:peroxiredoxin (alkyl hydroperoxide reductase subunit C)